jgi:hypothetical protein
VPISAYPDINRHGGFGKREWAVSFDPNDVEAIIENVSIK